jgi:hypothetical protein
LKEERYFNFNTPDLFQDRAKGYRTFIPVWDFIIYFGK